MLSDAIETTALRRVLVTKLRHHGDVLLTAPVLSVLKAHAPAAEIDALVYAPTAPMLGALAWLGTRKIVDNTRTSGYRESEAGSRVQIVAANGRVGDACCWRPRTGES